MEQITLLTTASDSNSLNSDSPEFEIGFTEKTDAISIPLGVFNHERSREFWQTSNNGQLESNNQLNIYRTRDWLIGWAEWSVNHNDSFASRIQSLYQDWCNAATRYGYPQLLRTWTYLPNITQTSNLGTPYQQFCEGRYQAYKNNNKETTFPAATVIGAKGDRFVQLFLSHQNAGVSIENPRQTSAFKYPVDQPEQAPLFSRALLHKNDLHAYLFISGTASITNHETQHTGDVSAQLLEALTNVDVLIQLANKQHQFKASSLREFSQVKVFIKRNDDYALVRSLMEQRFGAQVPIVYIHADMCRTDLLVEIEATCLLNQH